MSVEVLSRYIQTYTYIFIIFSSANIELYIILSDSFLHEIKIPKMRKYQQLILVLISIISVSILIVYRSENERLNHVLNVINFFGQKDSINLVKIENYSNFSYRFDYPLPTFINLNNDFHGYSAFWRKNSLVKGGEVILIAVGNIHSAAMFQVNYSINFMHTNVCSHSSGMCSNFISTVQSSLQ